MKRVIYEYECDMCGKMISRNLSGEGDVDVVIFTPKARIPGYKSAHEIIDTVVESTYYYHLDCWLKLCKVGHIDPAVKER